MRSSLAVILASALIVLASVDAFGPVAQSQEAQKVVIGTAEVVLDAIVTDRRGRPVRDLKPEEFEVYEDGARQRIESMRLIAREDTTAATAEKPAAAAVPVRTPAAGEAPGEVSAIALVFDRLTPEARGLARQAALAYANETMRPDDVAGVFLIDLSLHVVQPYTSRAALVRDGIESALARSPSLASSNASQVRSQSMRQDELQRTAAELQSATQSGGPAAQAASGAVGQNQSDQKFVEMTMRMLETFETLQRDQQGYATTNGLLSVVNSMRRLPGRKAVIFFSEGIAIPPAVQAHFRSVINAANRANVSIYPIDAAGLRVESANAETRREQTSLADRRMRQVGSGRDPTDGPMTRALERNEDLLRLNPHSGLGQLADETGGVLIAETNDLGTRLRQIDEDLRTYYLLSYAPSNQSSDGRFRQIEVRVKRAGLNVRARRGYYAINPVDASPVLAHEAMALAALNASPRPSSFPLRAAALHFPEAARPGLVALLVEAPASGFSYATDQEKKIYATDFSIVVLLRDEKQQVVRKLSERYLLGGPAEQAEAARRGEILFFRETELPPGRYTLEAVAADAPSARASVKTSSLEVKAGDQSALRMSSVAIIKRAERAAPGNAKKTPFHLGEVLVYPNLGEPVRKSASPQLAFFFTLYPAAGAAPQIELLIFKDGEAIGRVPASAPAADASGRIQFASALPLDKFPAGSYELRVTAKDARTSVTRSGFFTIE